MPLVLGRENPDVVFLQEVIAATAQVIEKLCPQYKVSNSNTSFCKEVGGGLQNERGVGASEVLPLQK